MKAPLFFHSLLILPFARLELGGNHFAVDSAFFAQLRRASLLGHNAVFQHYNLVRAVNRPHSVGDD